MAGNTAKTGVASLPKLFPLQKRRSPSSQRIGRPLFPLKANREDGFNAVLHCPTHGRRFAENGRSIRLSRRSKSTPKTQAILWVIFITDT